MKSNKYTLIIQLVLACLILGHSDLTQAKALKSSSKQKKIVSVDLKPKAQGRKHKIAKRSKNKKHINVAFASDIQEGDVEPLAPQQQAKLNKELRAKAKARKIASESPENQEGQAMPEKIHNALDDQQSATKVAQAQPAPSLKNLASTFQKELEEDADLPTSQ